eukprot:scaffold5362_cov67-Phaeocystis_antarctica.AAC.2
MALEIAPRVNLAEELAQHRGGHVAAEVGAKARVNLEDADLAARPHLVVEVKYAVVAAQEARHLLEVLRGNLAARDLGDLLDVRPHVLIAPILVRCADGVEHDAAAHQH